MTTKEIREQCLIWAENLSTDEMRGAIESLCYKVDTLKAEVADLQQRRDEAVKDIDYSITKFPDRNTEHTFVRNRFRDARDILTGGKNDE